MNPIILRSGVADQPEIHPPENALFKALPRLCITSPMPRIVAHDAVYRMLMARYARSAMISSDSSDCNIIRTFAHLSSTGASVGEKAVLVLKARNK